MRAPLADAGSIIQHKGRVFVAHYASRSTGATLYALDATNGRRLWSQRLRALGPVHHSQYLNEVQLRIDRDRVVAFGRESSGRYVEVRDPGTGALTGWSKVNARWAHLPWRWQGSLQRRRWRTPPIRLRSRAGGELVFSQVRHKREEVHYHERSGRERWRVRLPGNGFCGNASLAETPDTFYVVHYCNIATGATLHALRRSDGRLRWSKRLVGLGSIGHSKYFNDVQIEVRRTMVVIYGSESSGRYVEARHPITGALLSNRTGAL